MRLGTYGFGVGGGVDGRMSNPARAAAATVRDTTHPRTAGGYALRVSSQTGAPSGTTMDRLWHFGDMLAESPPHPENASHTYKVREGCVVRLYARWDTGDLPDSAYAVELLQLTDDPGGAGKSGLCIGHDGRLHYRRQANRTIRAPLVDNEVSTIVPNGHVVSDPLALDEWHMIEVAETRYMVAIRVNEELTFTLCRRPVAAWPALAPDPRVGWGVVYRAGAARSENMGAARSVYLADVAINDLYDDGGGQHEFPGPGRVLSLRPADHDYAGGELVDYSWVPGGPQSIFTDGPGNGQNGTLDDQFTVTPPHPAPVPAPPPSGTTFKDAFWQALRKAPMNVPNGSGSVATPNDFGWAGGGANRFGLGYDNINGKDDEGIPCTFKGAEPGMSLVHTVPPTQWPDKRNQNGTGGWPHEYMVTSGGSDWRGTPGAINCTDWQMILPRAGGQDLLKLKLDAPAFDGEVSVAHAWYSEGVAVTGRVADVPQPADEVALTPGLKVWAPGVQDEPPDTPWQALPSGGAGATANGKIRAWGPAYAAAALASDRSLRLKRTKSIGPAHANAYVNAAAITCYGAGVIVEDQAGATAALPNTCDFLLLVV